MIDYVAHVIETTPELRSRYEALCAERGQTVVNTWGGWWIGSTVERRGLRGAASLAHGSSGRYSKLDQPVSPKARSRKKKIEAAGGEVFVYFRDNKVTMPGGIDDARTRSRRWLPRWNAG